MKNRELEFVIIPGEEDLNQIIKKPIVDHVNREMGREVLKVICPIENSIYPVYKESTKAKQA
ncbi:hypothetical protein SAMN05444487_101421 [Marininema mesophilum]|uniref:Uncharacterized protein n=1 Tax=Marininema mesophilum TaxID=1048340 RepID=A0A1H2RAV4_9BACL|nr:hypothetical protein [Marininema mesophilum]SDW16415.1 hypothetical protein SAMN05444487_101421 [Marininema mesophilum]